ncbi:MAG: aminotransferase class V-fold PLP-dependent enzyme [Thermoleophilaceae bacterium]
MAAAVAELLARFVERLPDAPSADLEGADELARELRAARPPEDGEPLADTLATVEHAAAKAIDTAGPGYLAYIPGGGLFTSALGDLLAGGVNRYVTMGRVAPAMAAIEAGVVDWLCELFGYPEGAFGVLTSGGSMANLSAVVSARATLGEDFSGGTIYVSEQAHHSLAKAALIAGFPADAVSEVACDSELRMDPAALEHAIAEDRAAGRRPCLIVASAGTTNTGAIDPIPELADLAEREGVWLHADAAYGGFFRLTERGRERLAGIERADSITLDPHKGMFIPYGTGCLIVRDARALRRAHTLGAGYLQDIASGELPDFADHSPELSRANRGLRVWLPLQLHGVGAFRRALDEKLDLARLAHDRLSEHEQLELPWEPPLSTVAFRLRDSSDDDNRALLERINASRRVFISSTVIDRSYWLRISVLSHRTHRDRIEEAVEIVSREAAAAARTARAR